MKMKSIVSSVAAFALMASSVMGELPQYFPAAYAEEVNADYYHHTIDDEVVEIEVSLNEETGDLYCLASVPVGIPNITWETGAISWGELKSMYAGVRFDDFTVDTSIGTSDDFNYWSVSMMTADEDYDNFTWDGNYMNSDRNAFDFITDIHNDIPDSNLVRSLDLIVSMDSSAIESLGLKVGDTFTIALNGEVPERDIYFDSAKTLHWKAVEGAVGYRVKISNGTNTVVDECLENNSSNYAALLALAGFEAGTYEMEIYSLNADKEETLIGSINYEYTVTSAEVDENIFVYDINNGEATITGATINNPNVVIPAEIDGYPVVEIGLMALAFNYQIQTVVIPEGVKKLGWYAFNSCGNLTEVTLPESLEYIDSWAFERCKKLETIRIPANVTTVMGGAFAQNDSMTSIICDENNNNYVSVNGVLFTKDMKTVVAYPGGINGEYTVPATVNKIGDAAFYGAKGLTAVNILGTLDFIGFEGFAECELLTDVTINEGVNYIGYWAFRNCQGIKILTVPQSVTNIGDQALGYADYDNNKLDGFSIRGYDYSAAYYYALRHDIPFISIGNADDENNPFDDKNATESPVEVNPAADKDNQITTITINPAFNMMDKSEAGVGLDLTKIKIKAKEIYDEDGLKRASEALGNEIKGNTHYNLLDLTLLYNGEDFSNGYDGLVQVIIPIPAGHRDKTFSCYRLTEVDGKTVKEVIPGEQTEDSYIVYLEHFSEYALVGVGEEEDDNGDDTATTTPAPDFYKIDLKTDGHGKASANVENPEEVEAGTEVTLTATPNSGYKFNKWTVVKGGVAIKDNKFTMPESDVEIKAEFTKTSSGGSSGGSSSGGGGSSGGSRRPSSTSSSTDSATVTVNGKSGSWTDVVSMINSAANGGTITVSGSTDIPADVIAAAAKKNIKLEVKVNDTFTWVIDAAKAGEGAKNLSVTDSSITATNKTIKSGESSKDFRVTESKLGTGASLRYNAGKANSGKFANLFKVNGSALEFVAVVKVDAAGNALLPITAAGTYKIVISGETKLVGDLDNSMGLNALDAAMMLKKLVDGDISADEAAKFDFNGDGKTNALDAAAILKWVVNK